jgi:hypothetical protein
VRFPRRSQQSPEARAVIDEMSRRSFADDFEVFTRMQAESAEPGDWGDAYPYSRGSIHVTVEELAAFFEQYIELLKHYQRPAEDAPEDARLVLPPASSPSRRHQATVPLPDTRRPVYDQCRTGCSTRCRRAIPRRTKLSSRRKPSS